MLVSPVELSYLNIDMCKFESSQKDESRAQSADSSKAYRKHITFNCLRHFINIHWEVKIQQIANTESIQFDQFTWVQNFFAQKQRCKTRNRNAELARKAETIKPVTDSKPLISTQKNSVDSRLFKYTTILGHTNVLSHQHAT